MKLLMTGFELGSNGIRDDRSAKCDITIGAMTLVTMTLIITTLVITMKPAKTVLAWLVMGKVKLS